MSSEDWDLFAVVRSCSSSVSTTNSCAGHEDDIGNCKQQQDPPPPPLFQASSSCNELQDSCKPFLPVTTTTTTTWSPPPLLPPPKASSPSPNILLKQEQVLLESQDQKPPLSVRVFPPSTSSSVFVFRGQRDQLLQQQSQPPLRSRKRFVHIELNTSLSSKFLSLIIFFVLLLVERISKKEPYVM